MQPLTFLQATLKCVQDAQPTSLRSHRGLSGRFAAGWFSAAHNLKVNSVQTRGVMARQN